MSLTGSVHICLVEGSNVKLISLSSIAHIGLSTVQGSGPSLYIVMKSYLMTVPAIIFKYADDTTQLVPQNTDTNVATEFSHIKQ